jgi:hypothetical protein
MYKYYYLAKTQTGSERMFIGTSIKDTETIFNVQVIAIVGKFWDELNRA